jgi:hypothetical protein
MFKCCQDHCARLFEEHSTDIGVFPVEGKSRGQRTPKFAQARQNARPVLIETHPRRKVDLNLDLITLFKTQVFNDIRRQTDSQTFPPPEDPHQAGSVVFHSQMQPYRGLPFDREPPEDGAGEVCIIGAGGIGTG